MPHRGDWRIPVVSVDVRGQGLVGRVERALAARVVGSRPLAGGQVGEAVRCTLEDGRQIVAKASPGTPLEVEAFMLRYLREHSRLPVPEVLFAGDDLLVETYVEGSDHVSPAAERHAATLLADLHGVTADAFGFDRDTLIGPFPLDNAWTPSWPEFYAEHRLLPMGRIAFERGQLPKRDVDRIGALAARLPDRFDSDPPPALIHGDVWSGNVLARGDQIAAYLDPAIYFADAEVELAFIDLFHTFGTAFHDAYREHRKVDDGYYRWRRDLYQVFPLLVHVALFGGAYLGSLRRTLDRLQGSPTA